MFTNFLSCWSVTEFRMGRYPRSKRNAPGLHSVCLDIVGGRLPLIEAKASQALYALVFE